MPKCAQKRLAQIRALVDDYEAVRSNLQKRANGLMPDEVMDRAEIDKRMTANNKALSYAKSLLNQVDQWLQASGAIAHYAPTPLVEAPRMGNLKNTDWGRVEEIRKRVGDLKKQIIDTKNAPLPFATIEAQLKILVNKWASEGEPRLSVDPVRGHVEVGWGFNAPKSNKLAAWLYKDAMLEKLIALAKKQNASKGEALSADEKADRLKAIRENLAALELEEVAIIDHLQENGAPEAQHRLDISPAALLGVKEPKGLMRTELVA